jgi:ATP-dependent DNA helicase PIF1
MFIESIELYKNMKKTIPKELTKSQLQAYNAMISGKNIFLTGSAGSGKTYLIKLFVKNFKNFIKIAVTSTTGTSALLINGTTLHSFLGIGYGDGTVEVLYNKITKFNWLVKRWNELNCLIIDEISMLKPELFDKLEELARLIRKNDKFFGGIQLILSGDFCQLPAIGTSYFCFEAESWEKCINETIYLNEIIRQTDNTFQDILCKLRLGIVDDNVKQILNSCINKPLENDYGIKPTKLFSLNRQVDELNEYELDKLSENGCDFYEYKMEMVVLKITDSPLAIKQKFLKNTIFNEEIQLCIGAQVMLLINLDLGRGLANGSRGIITEFISDFPVVKFLNGEERIIDFHTWEIEENGKPILRVKQIPLKIAFAISIHKVQGNTLEYAEMDLSNVFEFGQAYVALSRVLSLDGLSIKDINYDLIKAHPKAVEYYSKIKNE